MTIDKSNYILPGFIPLGDDLELPAYSVKLYEDPRGYWLLYVNYTLRYSWLIRRAVYNGIEGWKILPMDYIARVKQASDYIDKNCRECRESYYEGLKNV